MIKIENLNNSDWIKSWAGKWSILTLSSLEIGRAKKLKKYGVNSYKSIIIIEKNFSTAFLDKTEIEKIGKRLSQKIMKDTSIVLSWKKNMIEITDNINLFLDSTKEKVLAWGDYKKFTKLISNFAALAFLIKNVSDYFQGESKEELLKQLQEARLYSEDIYFKMESFLECFARQISEKINYRPENILCFNENEFETYLKDGNLIPEKILHDRYLRTVLIHDEKGNYLSIGKEAEEIKIFLNKASVNKEISGQIAYGGIIRGRVRVILNPDKDISFVKGEILVTIMTRPNYVPLIKKAAAIITDAGGILSHAAIVAREYKTPCIIGTKIATQVLKDGDLVEVDANKGVVKILKKN